MCAPVGCRGNDRRDAEIIEMPHRRGAYQPGTRVANPIVNGMHRKYSERNAKLRRPVPRRCMERSQSGRCVDAAYYKRIVCGRDNESKQHGKYFASEMTQKNNSSGTKRIANIRVGPAGWS